MAPNLWRGASAGKPRIEEIGGGAGINPCETPPIEA
jgi:hypothetical protein